MRVIDVGLDVNDRALVGGLHNGRRREPEATPSVVRMSGCGPAVSRCVDG